jgi:hypothetical protein
MSTKGTGEACGGLVGLWEHWSDVTVGSRAHGISRGWNKCVSSTHGFALVLLGFAYLIVRELNPWSRFPCGLWVLGSEKSRTGTK